MTENNEPSGSTPIDFNLAFGPNITVPVTAVVGDDLVTGPAAPLFGIVRLDSTLLETDDLELLVDQVKSEVRAFLSDLVKYMTDEEYVHILSQHVLNCVATYRGTVLRKGIPNRETRRSNGERHLRVVNETTAISPGV